MLKYQVCSNPGKPLVSDLKTVSIFWNFYGQMTCLNFSNQQCCEQKVSRNAQHINKNISTKLNSSASNKSFTGLTLLVQV